MRRARVPVAGFSFLMVAVAILPSAFVLLGHTTASEWGFLHGIGAVVLLCVSAVLALFGLVLLFG